MFGVPLTSRGSLSGSIFVGVGFIMVDLLVYSFRFNRHISRYEYKTYEYYEYFMSYFDFVLYLYISFYFLALVLFFEDQLD